MNMRIKDTYKLRQMGSKHFIVRADSSRADFSEVFTLNETAAFLWRKAVEVSESGGAGETAEVTEACKLVNAAVTVKTANAVEVANAMDSVEFDESQMAGWLLSEYEVTPQKAAEDAAAVAALWRDFGFVEV